MPCPKCIAITKNGTSCKRNTCVRFPYCFQHMNSIEGLQLKKSEINDAGLGLFATRNFPLSSTRKQDPTITYYSSKNITNGPNDDSAYVLKVNNKQYLDSNDPSNFSGRYINSFLRTTLIFIKEMPMSDLQKESKFMKRTIGMLFQSSKRNLSKREMNCI